MAKYVLNTIYLVKSIPHIIIMDPYIWRFQFMDEQGTACDIISTLPHVRVVFHT